MSGIDPKTAPDSRRWFQCALASAASVHPPAPVAVATGPLELTPGEKAKETTEGGW